MVKLRKELAGQKSLTVRGSDEALSCHDNSSEVLLVCRKNKYIIFCSSKDQAVDLRPLAIEQMRLVVQAFRR